MAVVGSFFDEIQLVAGVTASHVTVGRKEPSVRTLHQPERVAKTAREDRDVFKVLAGAEDLSFPGVIQDITVAGYALREIQTAIRAECNRTVGMRRSGTLTPGKALNQIFVIVHHTVPIQIAQSGDRARILVFD